MTRIHGLDLARALAIIGMMIAHTGPDHFLTTGFPSVLFAVLAGISMGIIASRAASPADARFRLLVRAVILIGLGVVLAAVQSYIVIVLTAIGVSYVLLLPVLRWRASWLLGLLAGLVLLGPLVVAVQEVSGLQLYNEFVADLFVWPYPVTAWTAYTVLGLLIHRLALARETVLLVGGLAVFLLTQGLILLLDFRVAPGDELNLSGAWLQGEPHTGGLLDVLTSAGFSVAVIGACLLACRVAAVVWATYPVRSLGAMSLTVYVTHVIITTIANGTFIGTGPTPEDLWGGQTELLGETEYGWTMYSSDPFTGQIPAVPADDPLWPTLFVAQLVGFLVFASLWRWRFRRGPAEWAMHRAIEGAVGETAPAEQLPARR